MEKEYDIVRGKMTGKDWLMLILLKVGDIKHKEYRLKYNQKTPKMGSYVGVYIDRYLRHKSVKEIANVRGVSGVRISQILRRIDKISERNAQINP